MPGQRIFPPRRRLDLVTVEALAGMSAEDYLLAGYRLAGERAIRIDMAERLADLIRGEDARKGFEATPDMLSITGLSLVQFAGLMEGMGYQAEQGERPKVRVRREDDPAKVTENAAGDDTQVASLNQRSNPATRRAVRKPTADTGGERMRQSPPNPL